MQLAVTQALDFWKKYRENVENILKKKENMKTVDMFCLWKIENPKSIFNRLNQKKIINIFKFYKKYAKIYFDWKTAENKINRQRVLMRCTHDCIELYECTAEK